jgi:hypothetical protein
MSSAVAVVYRFVIDDVISKIKETLKAHGIDENVAYDLQKAWEGKLAEQGTYTPDADLYQSDRKRKRTRKDEAAPSDVQQPHAYMDHAAALLHYNQAQYQAQTGEEDDEVQFTGQNIPSMHPHDIENFGKPQQFMEPVSGYRQDQGFLGMHQDASNFSHLNLAPLNLPPVSTMSHHPSHFQYLLQQPISLPPVQQQPQEQEEPQAKRQRTHGNITQLDGNDDDDFGIDSGEDLNSEDDIKEQEDDAQPEDLVFALVDKVTRTKNKWKLSLKYGMMLLQNGQKDYVFNKSNGEFEW